MEIRGEAGWDHEVGLSGGWDKAWNVAPGNSLSCENPDPTVQTVSGQKSSIGRFRLGAAGQIIELRQAANDP